MKTQAIVPMAGLGIRFNAALPKPLVRLSGKPIFIYALEALAACKEIHSIVLVVHEDYQGRYKDFVEEYHVPKIAAIVSGGKERRDSVLNGLARLDEDTQLVLIHDGARPLVSPSVIRKAIAACEHADSVIVAVPVKPTIKRVDQTRLEVIETLDRKELWDVQTPQVFQKAVLQKAHADTQGMESTDDAFLVETIGGTVKVVEGEYCNIKITTPEDLSLAEVLLKASGDKE